jgi:hypothetical protein
MSESSDTSDSLDTPARDDPKSPSGRYWRKSTRENPKFLEFCRRVALLPKRKEHQRDPGARAIYRDLGGFDTFELPLNLLMAQLHTKALIQKHRDIAAQVLEEKYQMEESEILARLVKHATAELPNIFDEDGKVLPYSEWPETERAAVISVGDQPKDFKMSSAVSALLALAEIKGMKANKPQTIIHEFANLSDEELVRRAAEALAGDTEAQSQ